MIITVVEQNMGHIQQLHILTTYSLKILKAIELMLKYKQTSVQHMIR